MKNQAIISQFIAELAEIDITAKIEMDTMVVEFWYEKERQKNFNRIRDKYVKFWKSFGMELTPTYKKDGKTPDSSGYRIPLKLIGGEDYTDQQVDTLLESVRQRLGPIAI